MDPVNDPDLGRACLGRACREPAGLGRAYLGRGRVGWRGVGRRLAGLAGALWVLLLTAVCGGTTPSLTDRQQRAICAIGDRFGRLDMMPSGLEGMAIRVVTDDPDAARNGLRTTLTGDTEPALSIARIEEPKPQIAIVIDDLGLHPNQLLGLWALGQPITWALLPEAPHTAAYVDWLSSHGASMLIHLPMEPIERGLMSFPGYVRVDQSEAERRAIVDDAMAAIPGAVGFNNHMGSLLTTDPAALRDVIEATPPDFLVLDSRTTAESRLAEVARSLNRPVAERTVFLDHEREPHKIAAMLEQALAVANERGSAVAIGHPYPETVAAIRSFLARHGHEVQLVPIERISDPPLLPPWLRSCEVQPEGKGAAPPAPKPPAQPEITPAAGPESTPTPK
ncbi:MAG: divergent polysaccharide deacetylase family protein [Myxococcota bacterium]